MIVLLGINTSKKTAKNLEKKLILTHRQSMLDKKVSVGRLSKRESIIKAAELSKLDEIDENKDEGNDTISEKNETQENENNENATKEQEMNNQFMKYSMKNLDVISN